MKNQLSRAIDHFQGVRVLVLGDFLLDEFVFGEISRVSREAPVLILKHKEATTCPGGAANTVANAASLGAEVIPVGTIGDDPWGEKLLSLWPRSVNRDFVFLNPKFQTTRKSRILAGSFHSFRQQVVRLDYEQPLNLSEQDEARMVTALAELVPSVEVLVISDYSLGNLTLNLRRAAMELADRHSVPVVVDSRDDPAGYPGATTVTPNITEVEATLSRKLGTSTEEMGRVCSEIRRMWQLKALLVTRGKLGMSLFGEDLIIHIPAFGSDDVVDVTGAGDTVAATYSTALAAGASFEEAAKLANIAAGLVVMKKGTATVSNSELKGAVQQDV